MNFRFTSCLFGFVLFWFDLSAQLEKTSDALSYEQNSKIVILIEQPSIELLNRYVLPNQVNSRYVEISTRPIETTDIKDSKWTLLRHYISNGQTKFSINSDKPLFFTSGISGFGMASPGDSIHIKLDNNGRVFSGRGFNKLKLLDEIEKQKKQLKSPVRHAVFVKSLSDYLKMNSYLDKQLNLIIPLLNSYNSRIPTFEFECIKSMVINEIENSRATAFHALFVNIRSTNPGITAGNLAAIFDSTMSKPTALWLRSMSTGYFELFYYYQFIRNEVLRKFEFNISHDLINTDSKRWSIYYTTAKQNYKGLLREKLMAWFLVDKAVKLAQDDPYRDLMFTDYYSQSEYPEFKNWVRKYEKQSAQSDGLVAPDFLLTDQNGKIVTKKEISGKLTLINFWFDECLESSQINKTLGKIKDHFKNDTNVIFLSVSTDSDKNRWINSIGQEKNYAKNTIYTYTGGVGTNHNMIKKYLVSSCTDIIILDPDGKLISYPLSDFRQDNGEQLITILKKKSAEHLNEHHALSNDGPYVFYEKDLPVSYCIRNNYLEKLRFESNKVPLVRVQTDESGKSFSVSLKSKLTNEQSEFKMPPKVLALSDLEGNFQALRLLLQKNEVIDENLNWVFGKGHLVLIGDMFDRGLQVTECLWLIYSLEEKAKTAGGYIHFILGNHEIMNLQGNHRYVEPKYKDNAALMGKTVTQLFDETSELGRWLRTKNIIEKIGNLLFLHGGVSQSVNSINLSVREINTLARPYYAGNIDSSNEKLLKLFNTRTSPFWFRGYYGDLDEVKEIPTMEDINRSLAKFGVQYIVTGHSIVADTVSMWYDGKVINTDTKHAADKSEGLLVEHDTFFRVNDQGSKFLLFPSIGNNEKSIYTKNR